ncbi:disease resistance protein PIK6-NP-like [Quercus lobata]|uniref:disease resistance protein PIK6-NP-like n=1 Tax=Quercus lobata TaxID=97700 RepID=UPI00124738C0|nr:disease resistance protein PIK6-NP-like [Quercus lobata]
MAEGALFHLAEKVLELLRSLTLQEVKLASSVKAEIEKLTNTVTTIQAVILDAEKQSSEDHQIKDWLKKLKDVLHDADDLLDDFSTDVLRQKVMTKKELFIFQLLNLLDFAPPSTAAVSTSPPNISKSLFKHSATMCMFFSLITRKKRIWGIAKWVDRVFGPKRGGTSMNS